MKITDSKDGIQRTDVRVTFRLSKEDMEWILSYEADRNDVPEGFFKKEIERMIRVHLLDYGTDKLDWRGDHVVDDDAADWGKAAAEVLWRSK